jgi:hypothetical protein
MFPWAQLGMKKIKAEGKLNIQNGSWFYDVEKEIKGKRYGK